MDGRCQTCKWWGDSYWSEGLPHRKTCMRLSGDFAVNVEPALTTGDDGSALITTANFGCVQHEPRDAAEAE